MIDPPTPPVLPLAPRPGPLQHEPGSPEYRNAVSAAISAVRGRLDAACAAAGRDPSGVTLMAVTKFNPLEAVAAAYAAGIRCFGESRVQETERKFPAGFRNLFPGARLELIGHLQGNKAKAAVGLFDCVQSVDSVRLVEELGRRADAAGTVLDLLFELHTGEASKAGFPDEDGLFLALKAAGNFPSLRPRGLMTMAPYTADRGAIRASFRRCAEAFRRAPLSGAPGWDTISMGMTNDLELAVGEGSTLVRVGTAIFGERSPT